MQVLIYNKETEPDAFIKCECGNDFWVDPCSEENLVMLFRPKYNDVRLTEACPKCFRTNSDDHLVYPVLS